MKNCARFLLLILLFSPVYAADSTATQLQKAQTAFEKKAYKKCISLCKKILEKEPRSADAYYWSGRALEAQGKTLEAANEYQAALLARQNFPEASDGLNRVSSLLGISQVSQDTGPARSAPSGATNQ